MKGLVKKRMDCLWGINFIKVRYRNMIKLKPGAEVFEETYDHADCTVGEKRKEKKEERLHFYTLSPTKINHACTCPCPTTKNSSSSTKTHTTRKLALTSYLICHMITSNIYSL